MLNHLRHAWLHTPISTMLVQSAYDILGLDPTASHNDIKCAYRSLAKKWHPDKNCCDGSTAQFQQLNLAYHTIISCHIPTDHDENSSPAGASCVESIFNISLHTKQNTFSITIDITDLMFLVILSECQTHHGVNPIDRGVNGQQLRFPYTSPGESEHYGSISLTFYPTTSRLLVQGSSYLLWVEEHLPVICEKSEHRYMQDAGSWTALARRRGIGIKREGRYVRNLRSSKSSWSDDSIPTPEPSLSDIQQKSHVSPGDAFCATDVSTDGLVPCNPILLPVLSTGSPSTHHPPCAEVTAEVMVSDAKPSPQPSCTEITKVMVSDAEPSPGCADSTDLDPVCKEIGDVSETPPKKKRSKGKKSTKVKTKKKVSFNLPEHSATGGSDMHVRGCTSKCKVTNHTNMIRCSLCMAWYHVECAGKDSDYQGVWCCNSCRILPTSIQNLVTQIESLVSSVKSIECREVALKAEVQQLKAENGNLRSKLEHTVQHANDLAKLVETMSFSPMDSTIVSDARNSDGPTSHQAPMPSPEQPHITVPTANRFEVLSDAVETQQPRQSHIPHTRASHPGTVTSSAERVGSSTCATTTGTVIGSSIVRGVAPHVHGRGFDATGFVYPGRTARQINACIRKIPLNEITVLAAGTNNIEQQTVTECTKELHQIIDNVSRKRRGKTVIMSQLPYRFDKPELCCKIDQVNDFIRKEVSRQKHWYLLRHNLSREDYKPDGLHLNSRGTAKYAHEIRHIVRSVRSR